VFASRILVLIPHPDDEVVGCCAAIGRAHRDGAQVFGLYLSDGIPARELLWPWRRKRRDAQAQARWDEAAQVRARLGMADAGRLDAPTRTLRLRLAEAEAQIARVLGETQAQVIWCPAFEGAHQDHDAANALASRFAARAKIWEYAEYNHAGGRTRSQEFPAAQGGEIELDLDPTEQTLKRSLLDAYASERANLAHIMLSREAFRPLPRYDYAHPPHPGTLFYARFRWVPLHPRVDRTDPALVYRELSVFLDSPPP